jgi:peptidoglycan/LPS O-acetylase OafA/YrhL
MIEGLRGLAALVVFGNHLMVGSGSGWSPSSHWTWALSGPAAVLVFFVLSGYVIGLSHPSGAAPSADMVKEYFRHRAIRLAPINWAGVLLGCAVATELDVPTVLANLFFLQNFSDYAGHWVFVLRENPNLWSLNYEVLFYVSFALLWWRRFSLVTVSVITGAVGALGWFSGALPVFVACYAFGFLFWLAGLMLAWRGRPAPKAESNWPSCLLLALVTWKLAGLEQIMLVLHPTPPRFAGPVVRLYYLDFLPVCLWLVAAVGRRTFRGFTVVKIVAWLVPLAGFAMRYARHSSPTEGDDAPLIAAVYAGALLLGRWRLSPNCFSRLAWFGSISYALYATARPIQIAVFRVGASLSASPLSFALCAGATVVAALVVAWYLERRLQPALVAAVRR